MSKREIKKKLGRIIRKKKIEPTKTRHKIKITHFSARSENNTSASTRLGGMIVIWRDKQTVGRLQKHKCNARYEIGSRTMPPRNGGVWGPIFLQKRFGTSIPIFLHDVYSTYQIMCMMTRQRPCLFRGKTLTFRIHFRVRLRRVDNIIVIRVRFGVGVRRFSEKQIAAPLLSHPPNCYRWRDVAVAFVKSKRQTVNDDAHLYPVHRSRRYTRGR